MSLASSALDLRLKSVLVATDLSPASMKPLYEALAIARHYEAKVYIAHVVSSVPYLMAGPGALELACEGASRELRQLQRDLLRDGSLEGLDREFIIHNGTVWEELQVVILKKQVDLVAEQVFRDASCPVLTVGPHSYRESRVDLTAQIRTYLFATDFSEASLRALPLARSLAHQNKGRLILLHVVPAAPAPQIPGWYSASEITAMRENARMTCVRRLEQLVPGDDETPIDTEFVVQFGIPSEKILQVALDKRVDLIILGLRRASLAGTISHMPWATAYEIVCGAGCPVLSVRQ